MKTVRVELVLQLEDDQPVQDWILPVIYENLKDGEDIISYTDDEPVVETDA